AMGADKSVPCRQLENSLLAVESLRREGFKQILAVECTADAVLAWRMDYEFPLALVLGNEALGIAPETIAACDGVVKLPMFGAKESINVGNAAAAVLYAMAARVGLGEKE
ncbi:MAG: TrmH family RNA methyltransferase, partial [Victivallaceae bacterium]